MGIRIAVLLCLASSCSETETTGNELGMKPTDRQPPAGDCTDLRPGDICQENPSHMRFFGI